MSNEDPTTNLLPILLHAIPTVVSYRHLDQIVQANAEGARILARHSSTISEKLADDDVEDGEDDGVEDDKLPRDTSDDTRLIVTTKDQCHDDGADDANGVSDSSSAEMVETELFLKRVAAASYTHKSWTDMRRTLVYLRTEVRFYNEIVPLLLDPKGSNGGSLEKHLPKCYHAAYNLEGLIGEESPTTDVNAASPFPENDDENNEQQQQILKEKGGHILLHSLSPPQYFQDSPISLSQSLACLAAVAELHASAWGNIPLLRTINDRLSSAGGSYHLKFRNPKELKNMVASWESFRGHFIGHVGSERVGGDSEGSKDWTWLLEKESVANLGQRVYDMAEYISDELTPSLEDDYATLVHGDYKAMNVFLPAESKDNNDSEKKAIMIDFSCTGIGFGMSDVAMHIVHAVLPHHLENGGEEQLVEGYVLALENAMERRLGKKWEFPREVALRHYQLACVDYLRFIMGRFWRSANPEAFIKKKNSKNTTLINRNVDSAFAFIEKVDRYLEVFEKEKQLKETK